MAAEPAGAAAGAERRPRVLFAIGGLGRGGSERQLMELISGLHPARVEAKVLTYSTVCDEGHARRLRELGVELIQQPPLGGPRALRPLASLPRTFAVLRRLRPDVVYAWLEEASTTVTPAARALGVPVVIARRSVCGSQAEQQAIFRIAIRWAERRARLVTGNSEAVLDEAVTRGVPRERLRLVRNGHPPTPALPDPGGAEVRFGCVANYRPEKGHARLLAAAALVDSERPWRVDLVGAGEGRRQVEAEIDRRGLGDRVEARGPVTDIRRFWAEHDIALLLSDDEGSPNALIEAAVLGRPLIGTNGGGTSEVIAADGGILVSHEPGDIAAAMERLIVKPQLRPSMGAAARRNALELHDLGRFRDGHLGALHEALD
ncbi:MAG: glycosyltransferase [Solirubrobacterales bacterium]